MSTVRIQAKFVGVNSLGYERGEYYELKVTHPQANTHRIRIEPVAGTSNAKPCVYSGMKAFLANWAEVSSI